MVRRAALPGVVLGLACVAGCADLYGDTDVPTPTDASVPASDGGSGSDAPTTGEGASDSTLPRDAPAADVSGETGESGPPCNGGTCLSGQGCCGGCVDLQTDDSNCGACGHACGGKGACMNGKCLPIVLAHVGGGGIAVSGSTVFFIGGNDVYGCPLAGCGTTLPSPLYRGGEAGDGLRGIAFNVPQGNLLVSDPPDVVAVAAMGGGVDWTAGMPAGTGGVFVAGNVPIASGNSLFVGGYNLIAEGNTQALAAASFGTVTPLATLCSFPIDSPVETVGYDPVSTSVFGAAPTGVGVGSQAGGTLVKCPVGSDSGAFTSVATPPGAYGLVVSGQAVFVAVAGTPSMFYSDGGIYWSPTGTLSLNQGAVGSTFGGAQALTADATYLYFWSNYNNIYRCSIASHCSDATIVASALNVAAMTNDANFVYWAGSTAIAKLAKSP
jgi:hypothetical protein